MEIFCSSFPNKRPDRGISKGDTELCGGEEWEQKSRRWTRMWTRWCTRRWRRRWSRRWMSSQKILWNEEKNEFGFPFHSYFSFGWLPSLLSKCMFGYFFGYFSKVYFQRVFLETKGEGIWREAIWRGGEVTAAIFCLYRHFRWHFHPLQQSRRLYRDILIDSEQLTNLRLDLSQYYKAQHLSRSSQHRWVPGNSHRGARQGMVRAWSSVFVKCECVCIYNTYIYTQIRVFYKVIKATGGVIESIGISEWGAVLP